MSGHITIFEDVPTSGLPINVPNGVCGLNGLGQVAAPQLALAVLDTDVGVAGGVASLDGGGDVPLSQLGNVPTPGVPFSTVATFVRTLGDFSVNTGGLFTDCPGPIEVAVVTTGGNVLVQVQATGNTVVSNPALVGLGLAVDGIEQAAGSGLVFGGAQGCGINGWSGDLAFTFLVTGLAAGAHTFRLTGVSSGFGGGLGTVYASVATPLRMLVWYT
jgi:hypothetical protein